MQQSTASMRDFIVALAQQRKSSRNESENDQLAQPTIHWRSQRVIGSAGASLA
jgi:hypothetical protein